MLSCHEHQPQVQEHLRLVLSDLNGSFVKTITMKHIYASGNRSRIIFLLLNLVKHEVYPANAKTHHAEDFAAEARGKILLKCCLT